MVGKRGSSVADDMFCQSMEQRKQSLAEKEGETSPWT